MRNEVVLHQVVVRGDSVTVEIDAWPVSKLARFADAMNSRQESPELLQKIHIIQVRCSAAPALEDRKAERTGLMQRLAAELQRRDNWQFRIAEFLGKAVLLEDCVITPAIGAIEFGDNRRPVLDTDLVNTVLVTVERKKPAIAMQRQAFECFENVCGLQLGIGEYRIVRGSSHQWHVLRFAVMNITSDKGLFAIAVLSISACGADGFDVDPVAYEAGVQEWRADRLARLKGPNGYLNLAGLFWLQEGTHRIGSAADNDIVFPEQAAPYIGELTTTDRGVELNTVSGVDVRYEGVPIRSIHISDDTTDHPMTITHGSFAWTVIQRDGRFALRLRDFEHPAIEAFPPIEYYPIDPALRVRGTLHRFDEPKVMNVETVIEGLGYRPESPGTVAFEINGEAFELEAYASGDSLFFVFGDATSGRETYPAGRFLYADVPAEDGETVMDFNRAYNPPCAFNDFATCPVASPRNRLAVRIEAGEKFDPAVHSTPGSKH